jgi:hypothetical protein
MSTIVGPQDLPPPRPPADDPFRYGWRYVKRPQPDGGVTFQQLPLTLEDVLHPQEEDFRIQSDLHTEDCFYLKSVFQRLFPEAVVLCDCRIAWDVPDLRPHGPDVAVIFGAQRRADWRTFDVAVEGVRPALIVEVTSPDTRHLDLGPKVQHYYLAGVPFYVIADAGEQDGRRTLRLIGYRAGPFGYLEMPPDERGWLWLEPVQVWLGVEGERLRCYAPGGGPLPTAVELDQVSRAAEAEATQAREQLRREARARQRARREARRAREELQREAEARQQAQEQARATAEELRTLQHQLQQEARARRRARREARRAREQVQREAQARQQAEERARAAEERWQGLDERLRALEGELRRLRGDSGTEER